MDPLPQQRREKKRKGQAAVTFLRMVLLLNCCRGGASGQDQEEDQNERRMTSHAGNPRRTCAPTQKKTKKALGLFAKREAGKTGRNEKGGGGDGQNDGTEPSSREAPPRRQTSSTNHKSASEWRLPGVPAAATTQSSTGKCKKVTSAPELHELSAGPSRHEDPRDQTILFSQVIDKLNRVPVVFGSCEEKSKSEREPATLEQHEPRAGPSHLRDLQSSTITLREEKCATRGERLTKVPDDVVICLEDLCTVKETTRQPPTPSKLQFLYCCLWFLIFLGYLGFIAFTSFHYFLKL
ncbi:hypothetical protein SRHO_G00063600 [Serrasalmus rhombeus]